MSAKEYPLNEKPRVPASVHDLARALSQRVAEQEARRAGVSVDLWAHAKVRWVVGGALLSAAILKRQ